MKWPFVSFLTVLLSVFSGAANALSCQALVLNLPQGVSAKADMHFPDAQVRYPYCLVQGSLPKRLGIDGKRYQIKFEIRLPRFWQGRLAYQFNGGNDGVVRPALGNMTGQVTAQYAVNQGFAVISSNGGHNLDKGDSSSLIGSAMFGFDPQARRDFGYDAVRKLYPIARLMTERYYNSPIRYSYGIGASNGGRVAMVAATRFPNFFDGLLVGYPGINMPKAALQHAWDIQSLHAVNADLGKALTPRDISLFVRGLLRRCDGLDGLRDHLIFASNACQRQFEPTSLVCKSEFDRDCLPVEKVSAIIRMFQGPHNSKNEALYSSWVYDTGMLSSNWRTWKIESTVDNWSRKPIIDVLGAASLATIFMTPPVKVKSNPFSLEQFLLDFDFDKDAPKIFATNQRFPESAMTVMTPPDVMDPKLTVFRQHGGKMIIFHGNSDPVFSVRDTMRWYDYLNFNLAGKADQFVRFYRVPGMSHGEGGPTLDRFDLLRPLVNWVESQQRPNTIVAATHLPNPELPESMVGITRPLCPYPSYAVYQQGPYPLASSFACGVDAFSY
ncbi:tannase/feruloyl esterase family alpha/beta hydrolase [Marinomonas spartinae]|uniref:tannase/feruloyl esterase family alpha/beta hydrolase n=1 Tax=Marinomonas spartinae TaxID=1792290 RepID=UPI0018F24D17|nr:tannase/feruloyl esterase family alpha/beta hydrolase [Marinomonas spartinae]MBJ7553924.1 tannase/feruloyl esterase family alpha/beta hydrolase [Marinomonas spartinae]